MNIHSAPSQAFTLVDLPCNPVPADATVGGVTTVDGASLRYAHWKATRVPSKGTVIIASGRAEFIEKYFETISELRGVGFGVLSFDWRGQGHSSRLLSDPKKGYIDDFNQYVIDLETIVEEVALPDCRGPFFVLGHSTGSLVALLAAPRAANRIRRMVLVSPLLAFQTIPLAQPKLKFLAGFLKLIGLGELYVDANHNPIETRSFIGNRLTGDAGRFKRNGDVARADPGLAIGSATISWIHAACVAMDKAWEPDFMASITIPTMLVAAGNDRVVSSAAIEEYGALLRSGGHLTIDGAEHEILQEKDVYREQLLACFDAFVPGTDIATG